MKWIGGYEPDRLGLVSAILKIAALGVVGTAGVIVLGALGYSRWAFPFSMVVGISISATTWRALQ